MHFQSRTGDKVKKLQQTGPQPYVWYILAGFPSREKPFQTFREHWRVPHLGRYLPFAVHLFFSWRFGQCLRQHLPGMIGFVRMRKEPRQQMHLWQKGDAEVAEVVDLLIWTVSCNCCASSDPCKAVVLIDNVLVGLPLQRLAQRFCWQTKASVFVTRFASWEDLELQLCRTELFQNGNLSQRSCCFLNTKCCKQRESNKSKAAWAASPTNFSMGVEGDCRWAVLTQKRTVSWTERLLAKVSQQA